MADGIQRIKHADGSIEFTNVDTDVRKPRLNTRQPTLIYKSLSDEGDSFVFSDQKPSTAHFEIIRYDCFACDPRSPVDWHSVTLNTRDYADIVRDMADKYQVDPALVRAVIHAESAFNARALSNKGAQGLMQLMPGTARDLGVDNAFDVRQNIEGGVKYLAQMLRQFDGDIRLATAAYNAGPNAVRRFNGIPPYAETEVYVERVGILHRRYQQAG
ncbi:MAG: lytic transglycosylase domain-containing protein [Methylophaga sp.]|nr:lytic transglycosylase domain-containing protein [Methylophaga sp.]